MSELTNYYHTCNEAYGHASNCAYGAGADCTCDLYDEPERPIDWLYNQLAAIACRRRNNALILAALDDDLPF